MSNQKKTPKQIVQGIRNELTQYWNAETDEAATLSGNTVLEGRNYLAGRVAAAVRYVASAAPSLQLQEKELRVKISDAIVKVLEEEVAK